MLALAAQPAKTRFTGRDFLRVEAGSLDPAHSQRNIALFAKYGSVTVFADDIGYDVVRNTGIGGVVRSVVSDCKTSPLTNLQRGLVSLT